MNNKAPTYAELIIRCENLQDQVLKFLRIQQDLSIAKSNLDKDLARLVSIQNYNQRAIHSDSIEAFAEITVESVLTTFELECSMFFLYHAEEKSLNLLFQLGLNETAKENFKLSMDWIMSHDGLNDLNVFIEEIKTWSESLGSLGLHKAIMAPFYYENKNLQGMLLGGVTTAKRNYFTELNKDLIPSFTVFSQQMRALLQNLEVKKMLDQKVQERTAKVEMQKQEIQKKNEELENQKEELQSTLENLQKTQEQLIESEKMAAIGGLVAGVAHEMNTPVGIGITAISNLLDDVQKMAGLYEKDEISRKDFKGFLESTNDTSKLIQKNLERAASLIQSFKQVSTDQVTEQQRVFVLKEYLNDILLSLRPKFREKKIEFKIECDDELQLNSYPGVYAQIFTNLLLNSLQHGFHKRDTGSIGIKADMDKELMKIQYSDDGAGINKKDLPHIFEPFYTSDQHRGTGLGLNIIYNLVKQKLHGTITCESEPEKGVLFKIEVPVK
jgi:signal transduction histidine kinase